MNTDTMIALAVDSHANLVRTGARERRAAESVMVNPGRSLTHRARVAFGAALISAGGRLQGVATALPEPPAIGPTLSPGQ